MRYYYVPSTYRGRRFGKGIRGGALRGFGSLAAGTLKGGFLSVVGVSPTSVNEVTNVPEDVAKVQTAEATGQPVSIGKRLHDYWARAKQGVSGLWDKTRNTTIGDITDGIGNAASSVWNKVKNPRTLATIGTLAALQGIGDSGQMKLSNALDLAGVAYPALKLPAATLRYLGHGYKGGAKFKKGSPEAKAFMARLRAMRKKKKGGMFGLGFPKGVSPEQLRTALKIARSAGKDTVTLEDKTMDYKEALKTLESFTKMQNFWKTHNHRDFVRPKYSKKWKYMTEPRYASILNNLRNRMAAEMMAKWLVPQTNTAKKMKRTLNKWKRLQKGSDAAKIHMAKLRKMKKNKKQQIAAPAIKPFSDDDDIGDAAADIAMPPAAASAAAAAAVDPLAPIGDDDALADVLGTDISPANAILQGTQMAAKKKRKKAPQVTSHYNLRSKT